jgi:hypothetical protein
VLADRLLIGTLCLIVLGCGPNGVGPEPIDEAQTVVTAVTDNNAQRTTFLRVDAAAGRVIRRLDVDGYLQGGTASSGDTFFAGIASASNRRVELVAIDSRTLAVKWRQLLAEERGGVFVRFLDNGQGVIAALEMAVSLDGALLYTATAQRNSVRGIGALDLAL